ncbi:MAG: hypothetical protein CRU78_00355 [Candidatus Accumulibacter phosphatis]|uniref:Uncharacterized protein n=1 Tax=Candidatus Accumulibacter phosphatis TaxID=327160 RepID=A0A6A7RP65_9PROT|nr:hypothetical protein [Candidatus Accumulibacter phosphatis]
MKPSALSKAVISGLLYLHGRLSAGPLHLACFRAYAASVPLPPPLQGWIPGPWPAATKAGVPPAKLHNIAKPQPRPDPACRPCMSLSNPKSRSLDSRQRRRRWPARPAARPTAAATRCGRDVGAYVLPTGTVNCGRIAERRTHWLHIGHADFIPTLAWADDRSRSHNDEPDAKDQFENDFARCAGAGGIGGSHVNDDRQRGLGATRRRRATGPATRGARRLQVTGQRCRLRIQRTPGRPLRNVLRAAAGHGLGVQAQGRACARWGRIRIEAIAAKRVCAA